MKRQGCEHKTGEENRDPGPGRSKMTEMEIEPKDRRLPGKKLMEEKRMTVSSSFWFAFAGALVLGIIGHGMALFNKLSFHDDIFSIFMTGSTINVGRWMLYILVQLEKWFYGNGHFSIPAVNGVWSLVCIGLSAGVIVQHFRIHSNTLSALLGAVMAIFPAVASFFGFMFTVHYYMLALLMTVAGGVLICAEGSGAWGKKTAGVLLCGCAVGIYQAFIPVLLMIVLLDLIRNLLREEEKTGAAVKRALVLALCVAGTMGVYFAGNRFFLWKENVRLDDYLGISEMGTASLGWYLERAGMAYREFFLPTHNTLWDMYPQALYNVYRLMLCLDLLLGAVRIVQTWKRSPSKALLLTAVLALVPLGCNFIFLMSEKIHSLMVYGQVMQAVLLVMLADRTEIPVLCLNRWTRRGAALLLALCGIMCFRYDNQCYLKIVFQQQEAITWNTTLVTRIESAEGYTDELPVAFVNRENMQDRNLHNMTEFDFLTLSTYDQNIREYLNDWAWEAFLARWCGFGPKTAAPETVADWPEVQAMPSYPDDGSIQIIRDVVVVKF